MSSCTLMYSFVLQCSSGHDSDEEGTDECSEINTDVEGKSPPRRPLLVRPEVISSATEDEEEEGSGDSGAVQMDLKEEQQLEEEECSDVSRGVSIRRGTEEEV